MRYFTVLRQYLKPLLGQVVLLSFTIVLATAIQLYIPQLLKAFIDGATQKAALDTLTALAMWYLGMALGNQALGAVSTYLSANIGWLATNRLRTDLFAHVLRLDMRFHKDRTPGELIERIDGDVTSLSNFFSQFVVRVASSMLLAVGILIVLWRENWQVGLVVAIYTTFIFFVLQKRSQVAVPATTLEREASAQLYGFIEERLAGLDDIRANGAGKYSLYRLQEVQKDWFFKNKKAWYMRSTIWTSMMVLFSLGYIMILALGIWLYNQQTITLGTVYLFFNYMRMLEAPLEEITRQMQEFQKASAGIIRIEALQNEPIDVVDEGTAPLPETALHVQFEQVSFAYGEQMVLNNLNFELPAGQVMGLLGRTGSGKSTLVRLLFRLYDPSQGRIVFSGVDSKHFALSELRQKVGMVTQDVQLFHASIRDNLTFFDPSIPETAIWQVLDKLDLKTWIESLPEGLNTVLQAEGSGLSAGESQLLAFARVFLQNPALVILDEPSSRLDPATERKLNQATQELLRGRTGIIIAHRLDTVERADQIMVLAGGEVAEYGNRESLKHNPSSRYAQMLAASGDATLDNMLQELI